MHRLSSLITRDKPIHLASLIECMQAALEYYGTVQRNIMFEMQFVQPLIREGLMQIFTRVLTVDCQCVSTEGAENIRQAVRVLLDLCKACLIFADQLGGHCRENESGTYTIPEDIAQDVSSIMYILYCLMQPGVAFWDRHSYHQLVNSLEYKYAEPIKSETGQITHLWFIDTINYMGEVGLIDAIQRLFHQTDNLSIELVGSLLSPISAIFSYLKPERKAELSRVVLASIGKLKHLVDKRVDKIDALALPSLIVLLHQCIDLLESMYDGRMVYKLTGELHQSLILQLLNSAVFSKQLTAVRELSSLLQRMLSTESYKDSIDALTCWLEQNRVVRLVLEYNLHQQQYVEQVQRSLAILLRHGKLSEHHLSFLWNLIEDSNTFEEIKSNVYRMLGSLGPYLKPEQLEFFFSKLESRSQKGNLGDAVRILELLVSMAATNAGGNLARQLADCMCAILVRKNAPIELADGDYIVDMCKVSDSGLALDCALHVLATCMDKLTTSPDCISAVVVMKNLLVLFFQKLDMRQGLNSDLNHNGLLLASVIQAYSRFLELTHRRLKNDEYALQYAVEAWHGLIWELIIKGNWYVSASQLNEILSWCIYRKVNAHDSKLAWQLLIKICSHSAYQCSEEAACDLFNRRMCELSPSHLDENGWACFIVYMRALGDWNGAPQEGNEYIHINSKNVGALQFIWKLVLEAPLNTSFEAAKTLAAINIQGLAKFYDRDTYHEHICYEIRSRLDQLYLSFKIMWGSLQLEWHTGPRLSLGDVGQAENLKRTLEYLHLLVSQGRSSGGLFSPPLHSAAFQDFEVSLTLQLPPHLDQSSHLLKIRCPRNMYIGNLKAQTAIILGLPALSIRLFGAGKEFRNNSATIEEERLANTSLIVSISGPSSSDGDNFAEDPASILANEGELYNVLLALSDPSLDELSLASMKLLDSIPTCATAKNELRDAVFASDSGVRLQSICVYETGEPKPGILLYALQSLCELLTPACAPRCPDTDVANKSSAAIFRHHFLESGSLEILLNIMSSASGARGFGLETHRAMFLILKNCIEHSEMSKREPICIKITHYLFALLKYALEALKHIENLAGLATPFEHEITLQCGNTAKLLRILLESNPELLQLIITAENDISVTAVSTVVSLLGAPLSPVQQVGAEIIIGISALSHEAHFWIFTHIIIPLLEAPALNNEELEVCTTVIKTLHQDEFDDAKLVMRHLMSQLQYAVAKSEPLETLAMLAEALFLKVGYPFDGLRELVSSLFVQYLFPEILSEEGGAAFEAKVLSLAQHNVSSREAVFSLVYSLMIHDLGVFESVCHYLKLITGEAEQVYKRHHNNTPLPSVRPTGAYVGLGNGGATCYMNSVLQQLFMQPTIQACILSSDCGPEEEEQGESILFQVQKIFAHLKAGIEIAYRPYDFWCAFKDFDGEPVNIKVHQDAHEFFTQLQDTIDEGFKASGHPRAIYAALGGAFTQTVTPLGRPDLSSQREEEFYQIQLDVRGKRGLTESLDSLIQPELMNGVDQYFCEELNAKVDAEKRSFIARLPDTLVFQLKRFEYDYETLQRLKIKDRFEFPLELNVLPYTMYGMEGVDNDQSLPHPGEHYMYELSGMVVHTGTAFAGHYYSYIRERTSPGGWFCFDDTTVEPWDLMQLDPECFGGHFVVEGTNEEYERPNSAYILFYDRKTTASLNTNAAMHPTIQDYIAAANMKNLGHMHVFGHEYFEFMQKLLLELKSSVQGGAPRKAQRTFLRESPNLRENHNTALMNLAAGRSTDFKALVMDCFEVCLEYYARIVSRGSSQMVEMAHGKGRCWYQILNVVMREHSEAAEMLMWYLLETHNGDYVAMTIALGPPSVREAWMNILKMACNSLWQGDEVKGHTNTTQLVQWVFDKIGSRIMGIRPHGLECFEILEKVADAVDESFPVILQPYADLFIRYGRIITDVIKSDAHEKERRYEQVTSFLACISLVVRRFCMVEAIDNPYCHETVQSKDLVPQNIYNFLCDVETWQVLLVPGCFENLNVLRLFQWLVFENEPLVELSAVALLSHISELDDIYDFAAEAANLKEAILTFDSLSETRACFLLQGIDKELGGTKGLLYLSRELGKDSIVRSILVIWLVLGLTAMHPLLAPDLVHAYDEHWVSWACFTVKSLSEDPIEQRNISQLYELENILEQDQMLAMLLEMGASEDTTHNPLKTGIDIVAGSEEDIIVVEIDENRD